MIWGLTWSSDNLKGPDWICWSNDGDTHKETFSSSGPPKWCIPKRIPVRASPMNPPWGPQWTHQKDPPKAELIKNSHELLKLFHWKVSSGYLHLWHRGITSKLNIATKKACPPLFHWFTHTFQWAGLPDTLYWISCVLQKGWVYNSRLQLLGCHPVADSFLSTSITSSTVEFAAVALIRITLKSYLLFHCLPYVLDS